MRHAVLAAVFVFSSVSPALAVDYHVAPGGSDAADGLSALTAWATLQKAADTVAPGDTVHVADGNYTGFDLRTPGTAANPIVFLADGSNAAIVADNGVTPDGINIENSAYNVIDGFVVDGRTRAGIRAAVSHHITVRNCHCGQNGHWGIFTGFVDDLLLENNETWGSVIEHGIYASNSGDRPVIRGNHSHDNHANGIHMNGDASAGGDGLISNALVENNRIHGNGVGGGSGINMDGVTGSVIRNNLLYDNHASGISLYRIDGATGSTGNLVINNTILNASNARWCININNGSTGNTLRNNILYNAHSFRGVITVDASSLSGFTSDYNSLMDRMSNDGDDTIVALAAWQSFGFDVHSFVAVPAANFFNPAGDFRLLPSSPAIDSGTATSAPGSDLAGGGRPVGSGFDMGAYEAQLADCDDGNADAGEICGEPSLPACADPCSTCLGCICAAADPVCGDALVCGSEQCESDTDCDSGQVCRDCTCRNAPLCTSGILLERPRLKARSTPFQLKLSAEVLIPKPWIGVDPVAGGVRIVVDSTTDSESIDASIPGGGTWKVNGSGTQWTYSDKTGSVAGLTKVVVRDRSKVEDGRLKVTASARTKTTTALPSAAAVRTTVVLGSADECGALDWNPPGGQTPACRATATGLDCR